MRYYGVMEQQQPSSAKDFFLNLFATAVLFAVVITFIVLWFNYIDALIVDELGRGYLDPYYNELYNSDKDTIRLTSSILLVLFPALLIAYRLLNRQYRLSPHLRESRIHRWLGYLTLFASIVAIRNGTSNARPLKVTNSS